MFRAAVATDAYLASALKKNKKLFLYFARLFVLYGCAVNRRSTPVGAEVKVLFEAVNRTPRGS